MLTCFSLLTSMRYLGDKRPVVNISVGGKPVKALLDTGSAVTLCNSSLLKQLKEHSTRQRKKNLDLRAATGAPLCIRDIRKAEVHLNGHHTPTEIIFVDNLQVQCILGMDYLNQAGIIIDAGERKLLFKKPSKKQNRSEITNSFLICTEQDMTIHPMQESKVVFRTPDNFKGKGFVCSHPQLNEDLAVMEGVIDSNGLDKCAVVVLNISQQIVQLPKKAPLAQLERCPENNCKSVNEVFTVKDNTTKLTDISHIKNIDLTHVPSQYLNSYKSLLTNFADVFSKHYLDVGPVSYTHLTLPTKA